MTGNDNDKQQMPQGTHQDSCGSVALYQGQRCEGCGVAAPGIVIDKGVEEKESLAEYYLTDEAHIENVCVSLRLNREDYLECAERLLAQWRATDEQDWSRRHFFFALKDFIKFNYERDKTNRTTHGVRAEAPRAETPEQWKQRIAVDALSRYQQEINTEEVR